MRKNSVRHRTLSAVVASAMLLAACGGGGSGSIAVQPGGGNTGGTPSPTPTPPATGTCALGARQSWVLAQMREWYLFPETLPAALDPAGFSTLDTYVDGLTATARTQGRDRFFTYVTSIAEENAFNSSGATAGFGFRLAVNASNQLVVSESFEDAPALAAGIDRGTQIIGIGTTTADVRTVQDIVNSGGNAALTNAFGPDTPGTTRVLRVRGLDGFQRDVSVAKANFNLSPVSSRYGARVIDNGGQRVGYLNLRTFILSADPQMREAFARFRAEGITNLIVDVRYNGGGLLSTAELLGDLMGGDRTPSQIFSTLRFRPEKTAENRTKFFAQQPQTIAPMRVAFIGTGGSASASELIVNAFIPYLNNRAALIGTNTFGKPVGQIALDRAECDDRLRVVAFATVNADNQGDYYGGLASTVRASCQASDDLNFPMGDPREQSTARALDFLAGRSCTPIAGTQAAATMPGQTAGRNAGQSVAQGQELLVPLRPTPMQREVPGAF
ncbi:S41 family peptidase [Sphingomonas sp. S1-29]|uniref:S41 family peptidase n=1 Tax=Sphingomonas sp. S1-29 TaxID=2991074 RepID=UPI00223F9B17|nr:S41 family peptidase [Sphingomonas sp. S1-29]UZK69102.1 S41 family peptidase [Sphingomonas sp. S1-29]